MMQRRRAYTPGGIGYPGYAVSAGVSGPFGGHATLANDIVSYWKLNEESGTRVDSITASGNDLTDNNTVGFAAGMSGNAASFIQGNNEYLSHASLPLESYSGYTVAGWLYVSSSQTGSAATGSWNARGWNLLAVNSGGGVTTPRHYCFGNGQNDSVDWSSTVAPDAFHHVLIYYDGSVIGIAVDGGTSVTLAHTVPPDDTALAFNLGRTVDGSGNLTGRWDEFGIWSRALTAQERTDLYNGGTGLFY